MDDLSICVVILTVNQRDKTVRCLRSLADVDRPDFDIVVWDNGSSDGTIEEVRSRFPDVHVHAHPLNIGAAAGRNAAVDVAMCVFSPRLLLFLDNDMVVDPGFLEALAEPFRHGDPSLAQTTSKVLCLGEPSRIYEAGGCRIDFVRGGTRPRGHDERDEGQYEDPIECLPSSGSMLIRAGVFQEVGAFDPAFDPYGLEDLDLSTRVRKAGYRGLYVPLSVVLHERGQTFESGYTAKYAQTKARNWLTFLRKHAAWYQRVGFYLIGAPLHLAKATVRETRRGNLSAVGGLVRGGLNKMLGRGR